MCTVIHMNLNNSKNKPKKTLKFFYLFFFNYKSVYWKYISYLQFFFMWIMTYKNKGLKPVFFFLC